VTALRLAVGLAANSAPEHRWRRVAVPLSALLFMLLILAATSVELMVKRQNERTAARRPAIASMAARSDVFMRLGHDTWRGRSIVVGWIEPASPEGKPVLAPGMARFPEPGQAVVSPELARLVDSNSGLADRYRRRMVLGDEGLGSGGELVAYVRPATGRRIGEEASATWRSGGRWRGRGPVARVSGFGGASGLLLGDPVSTFSVGEAAFGLLCIPAVILLAIGLAAASPVRDHRFRVLAALGAPSRTLRTIAALEGSVLAIPALVAAALLWFVVMPHVDRLPFPGYRVVRGDLAVPAWLLLTEFITASALCAFVSTTAAWANRRPPATRPVGITSAPSMLALMPLGASIGVFLVAMAIGGTAAADLNALGVLLAIAGTPLVLPFVLRAVGDSIRSASSVAPSLAGSAMSWDPRRVARPFMGLGALLVIALVGAGYTALVDGNDEGRAGVGSRSAVALEWHDRRPGDLDRLDARLQSALVVPFRGGAEDGEGHGHGTDEQTDLYVGATCRIIARYVATKPCDDRRPYALSTPAQRQLAEVVGAAQDGPPSGVRLVPRSSLAGSGTAFAIDAGPLRRLDERARSAAMAAVPAPIVDSRINREPETSALVDWIAAGGTLAVIALTIACLVSLIDRLLTARRPHRHLVNLGISTRQVTVFAAVLFAVPYGVMAAFGLTTGLTICVMMLDSGTPIPWRAIGATLLATVAVGALGSGIVAALGSREALREAE
jgi:hypothetical protein